MPTSIETIQRCQQSKAHVVSLLSTRVLKLIVHHNFNIAAGKRDRPQWQLTEAAVKDEDNGMKCADPLGLSPIHHFLFQCSSLVQPLNPSITPSASG